MHQSAPSAAVGMAHLSAAAQTVAAVAAAGADRGELQLSLPALEQPALDRLGTLCNHLCSTACEGRWTDVEASSRCLCSVLSLCAHLKYNIEDQVSSGLSSTLFVTVSLAALFPLTMCSLTLTLVQAAQHIAEAIAAILSSPAPAAWAPALAAADNLLTICAIDLENAVTAFAERLGRKPTVRGPSSGLP